MGLFMDFMRTIRLDLEVPLFFAVVLVVAVLLVPWAEVVTWTSSSLASGSPEDLSGFDKTTLRLIDRNLFPGGSVPNIVFGLILATCIFTFSAFALVTIHAPGRIFVPLFLLTALTTGAAAIFAFYKYLFQTFGDRRAYPIIGQDETSDHRYATYNFAGTAGPIIFCVAVAIIFISTFLSIRGSAHFRASVGLVLLYLVGLGVGGAVASRKAATDGSSGLGYSTPDMI